MCSEYAIKIMYADWVHHDDRIAFPKNRYSVATNIVPGTKCLVYLTGPIKRIVTVSEITSTVYDGKENWPNHEIEFPRWPYVVPHNLLISYKKGLGLEEIRELGLPKFRPRPGDTYVSIDKDIFEGCKKHYKNKKTLIGKTGYQNNKNVI